MRRTAVADPCRCVEWSNFPKLIIQLMVAVWLMCLGRPGGEPFSGWSVSGLPAAGETEQDVKVEELQVNCLERIVTSGTFDDYYRLEDIGNAPSEQYPVNLSLTVVLGNQQEELGVLLSDEDRSLAHPDYARTYEMRLTSVYTVLYRETIKLQAYHSPRDKLFTADTFRLRFLVSHDGNVTVLVNEQRSPRPLLAVYDKRPPLALHYISFSSRMNAYPVRFFLGCGMAQYTNPPRLAPSAVSGENRAEPRFGSLLASPESGAGSCPVCPQPQPQRCEVVVKACADPSPTEPEPKDPLTLNTSGATADSEPKREKYYFFFTMHLTKNRNKSTAGGI